MQKISKFIAMISILALQESCMHAKPACPQATDTAIVINKTIIQPTVAPREEEFIGENGVVGIYQPRAKKADINEKTYINIQECLVTDSGKVIGKPRRKTYLGKLIDGNKKYALYGKESDPAPLNNGPDADVRTEEKIDEDFGRNLGSGKYTPNDKWD